MRNGLHGIRGISVVDGKSCDACMEDRSILMDCPICKGEFCSTCIGIHGCRSKDL